jgi:hypothetical protein
MLKLASVPLHVPIMSTIIYDYRERRGKREKKRQLSERKNCASGERRTLCATFVRTLHGKGDVVPRARTWRVAADGGYGGACVCIRSEHEAQERKESAE